MELEHIKNLLQLMYNFNMTSISHSVSIGEQNVITVRCLPHTYILEVTSSETGEMDYYISIEEAAEVLHEKIKRPRIG